MVSVVAAMTLPVLLVCLPSSAAASASSVASGPGYLVTDGPCPQLNDEASYFDPAILQGFGYIVFADADTKRTKGDCLTKQSHYAPDGALETTETFKRGDGWSTFQARIILDRDRPGFFRMIGPPGQLMSMNGAVIVAEPDFYSVWACADLPYNKHLEAALVFSNKPIFNDVYLMQRAHGVTCDKLASLGLTTAPLVEIAQTPPVCP